MSVIVDFIEFQLRTSGQMHGYRWLHIKCLMYGFTVTRETVRQITRYLDPVGVDIRSRRRLRRRNYHAKGPNYIWHADGYDKLKSYGLCIHGCIDGFSRKIIWMEVNHTNNDPFVTAGYFFDALKHVGGCPTRVRVDCGTENTNIEAAGLAQWKSWMLFVWNKSAQPENWILVGNTSSWMHTILDECFQRAEG